MRPAHMRTGRLAVLVVGLAVLVAPGTPLWALASAAPHGPMQGSGPKAVCPAGSPGYAHCDAWILSRLKQNSGGSPTAGLTAAQLEQAYSLPSATGGVGQTVAIVDAYDNPRAVSDLNTYRSTFHLPACATPVAATGCTFTNGASIRKVAQDGSTRYPSANVSWGQEISLDLDMVSAICPNCSILLVEATSNSIANLSAAVDEAAALHATEISNSYGAGETSGELASDVHFNHPGVAVTASTGDSGYGVEWPAASPYVTAVGGTSLHKDTSLRGWSETAWSGAGSGCSAYEPQPAWQTLNPTIHTLCARRAVADVSAVADPNTGVSVYDSYGGLLGFLTGTGWLVFGGTSVASPIVASVYALAGNASTVTGLSGYGGFPYSNTLSLTDVLSGSNGSCGSALCTAGVGWDGPTGLGSPSGTGAF